MSGLGWPSVISRGDLRLRPLAMSDERAWHEVRSRSADWLSPWEASNPSGTREARTFREYVRAQRREARRGTALPLVVEHDGAFAGQITLGNIVWGSLRSGYVGYWIAADLAGRGIATTSLAMLIDYSLAPGRLHRVEVNIRPENSASLRVVEKLGLREEGLRKAYLHIAGQWCDHRSFAVVSEELPVAGFSNSRPLSH